MKWKGPILVALLGLHLPAQGIRADGSVSINLHKKNQTKPIETMDYVITPHTSEDEENINNMCGATVVIVESDSGTVRGKWTYEYDSAGSPPSSIGAFFPAVNHIHKIVLLEEDGTKIGEEILGPVPDYPVSITQLSPTTFHISSEAGAWVSYDNGVTWEDPLEENEDGTIRIESGADPKKTCIFASGWSGLAAGCAVWPSSRHIIYGTSAGKSAHRARKKAGKKPAKSH